MDIYFSYWSKGYRKELDELTLLMHKISAHLAKCHYGADRVFMLTDRESHRFFADCGYTSIVPLEGVDEIDPAYGEVWSLGKLFAYRQICDRGKAFCHLDYDVFLWKRLPAWLENAACFVQNKEWDAFNKYEADKMKNNAPNKGLLHYVDSSSYAYNVGIFGGTDLDFIRFYANKALHFVLNPDNKEIMLDTTGRFTHFWSKATIAEQLYLRAAEIAYGGITVQPLFDLPYGTMIPAEAECQEKGYTHLWGAKNNPEYRKTLTSTLRQVYKQLLSEG